MSNEAKLAMAKARRDAMRSVIDQTEQVRRMRQNVVCQMLARMVREAHRVCYTEKEEDQSASDWSLVHWRERNELMSLIERCARNPYLDASDIHQDWVDGMTKAGWRHGPEFNSAKMERPEMTRFDELPIETQRKYHLAVALTRVMRDYCDELEDV